MVINKRYCDICGCEMEEYTDTHHSFDICPQCLQIMGSFKFDYLFYKGRKQILKRDITKQLNKFLNNITKTLKNIDEKEELSGEEIDALNDHEILEKIKRGKGI